MSFQWVGKSEDGSTVTLRKLDAVFAAPAYATPEWVSAHGESIRLGVVVDVETTGLDRDQDQVIEIGLRQFAFNRANGDLLSSEAFYTGLQDPGEPLSEEIQALTGLDDSMLRGQSIDWEAVSRYFSDAQIIIAHNAGFDRRFIDRHCAVSSSKIWGCSLKQIDWAAKGYPIQKLEVLGIYHGYFTDAHRAMNDVNALTYLLSLRDGKTGHAYLNELLANARRPLVRVIASGSPFESKDLLRSRGYRWDSAQRFWHKSVYKDELDSELSWLEKSVYGGKFAGSTQEIPVTDNFKG